MRNATYSTSCQVCIGGNLNLVSIVQCFCYCVCVCWQYVVRHACFSVSFASNVDLLLLVVVRISGAHVDC